MIHGNPKKLLASLLAAVVVVTSMPYSVYAAENVVFESEMNESKSGEETKMSEETAVEERFEDTKTDTQEIGEEGSTDESVTDIVEPELSTEGIRDGQEESATEALEEDETQTDVEETLEDEETETDTEEALEEDEALAAGNGVAAKLEALKSTYPDGKYWWRVNGANSSVTDKPCPSQPKDKYGLCYGTDNCGYYRTRNGGNTYQCVAFAYNLFNLVFGEEPSNYLGNRTDTANIMVGDYVRFGIGHSAIVIGKNGNMLVLAESNWKGPCKISWGREYSVSNVIGFCHASNYDTINNPTPHGTLMPTPSGIARVIPDGDYQLVSAVGANMDIALDVPGNTYDVPNDANCQIWQGTIGSQYDVFTVKYNTTTQYYSIVHKGSGKALDLYCGNTARGTNVQYYDNHGGDPQQWAISSADNRGFYYIQAKSSGYYLDVAGGDTANGTNVQVWEQNESNAQKWAFVPYAPSTGKTVSEGDYYIAFANDTTKRLSINSNSTYPNAEIRSAVEDGSQVFTVKYYSDGTYRIRHKKTGRNLDIEGWGTMGNVGVWDGDSNGNPNGRHQCWVLKSADTSSCYIVSHFNGTNVDLSGGITTDGNNITVYSWNGTVNQKWKFISVQPKLDPPKPSIPSGTEVYPGTVLKFYPVSEGTIYNYTGECKAVKKDLVK